jgi:hypothetical protein
MTSRSELFAAVDDAFSEDRALEVAVEMTEHYRAPGTRGYQRAMETVQDELKDGDVSFETDYPEIQGAWQPNGAELWLDAPERTKLTDYESAPACVAWGSSSTEGSERLELVDVGTGEFAADFEGRDVEGKAVFIHGTERRPAWWEAAKNAVERGARGIVTDYMLYQTPEVRTPDHVRDASQLLRLRPRSFFDDRQVWAFSLTQSTARHLRERLAEGTVVVEADVDVDFVDSELPYVEATIPGTERPKETVLLCGHASGIKPGANCAEGTGVVVELARALQRLVESGGVPAPRRSITFIIGAEGPVSEHYLSKNPDAAERVVTSLTYCSAGHRQSETESCLLVSQSPDSTRSFVNDYLAELARQCPKEANWIGKEGGQELPLLAMKQHYYTPWSDNARFASKGIPAPLFMSWPDRCFHSELLTEDVIDPRALRRSALISGVAALDLAAAGDSEADSIARLVAGRSVDRLRRLGSRVEDGDSRDARRLRYVADRDIDALQAVNDIAADSIDDTLNDLADGIRETAGDEIAALDVSDPETRATSAVADLVPERTDRDLVERWAGLDYEDLLEIADELAAADANAGWRSLRVVSDEAWNFVDGERNVAEIADAVGFEFDLEIEPEPVHRILAGHESAGNLNFQM